MKLVHVSIRVNDAEKSAAFYRNLFGFRDLVRLDRKNLTAFHMTDGQTYISVVQYHDESTAESRVGGKEQRIHHIGLEVDEPFAEFARLVEAGCQPVSPEGELPIKFVTPEGIMAEIAQPGFFEELLTPKATA